MCVARVGGAAGTRVGGAAVAWRHSGVARVLRGCSLACGASPWLETSSRSVTQTSTGPKGRKTRVSGLGAASECIMIASMHGVEGPRRCVSPPSRRH